MARGKSDQQRQKSNELMPHLNKFEVMPQGAVVAEA
jgi:hypothetical protein